MQRITDLAEASALVSHLLAPGRRRTVCVVSIAEREVRPYIDMDKLERALGDLVDYVVITTGELTRVLERGLPQGASVFGGAARVYPVDPGWQKDPYAFPLVLCRSRDEGAVATERLIKDGLRFGSARHQSALVPANHVSGEVRTLVPPTTALVRADDGTICTILSDQVQPELHIEQLVRSGQRVSGRLDPESRTLVLDPPRTDLTSLVGYENGAVVLGRVAEVYADRALVELIPTVTALLMRDDVTGNHVDRLASVLEKGEVVRARVARVGEPGGKPWKLTMLDVEDDEVAVAPPALLPDGPSWLKEGERAIAAPTEEPAPPEAEPEPTTGDDQAQHGPADPGSGSVEETVVEAVAAPEPEVHVAPRPGQGLELRVGELESMVGDLQRALRQLQEAQSRLAGRVETGGAGAQGGGLVAELMRVELQEARDQVRQLTEAIRRLEAERDRLRDDLSTARREARQAAKKHRHTLEDAGPAFLDPEEAFRWRVQQSWARRIPAAEKPHLPLGDYVLLPGFLPSLAEVHGIEESKVADVVVDIVTGRVHEVPGYQTHQLRESESSDRFVTRDDGATCWRVALQVNTPSARRLHYWQPPGGRPPEMSSVRVHDDARP